MKNQSQSTLDGLYTLSSRRSHHLLARIHGLRSSGCCDLHELQAREDRYKKRLHRASQVTELSHSLYFLGRRQR